ncbi:SNF2 family N-terminal domain-containing protein [Nemania abortiva]|nr:SNF2 family N-terminal domain-containing protein [Nemania abortiva]
MSQPWDRRCSGFRTPSPLKRPFYVVEDDASDYGTPTKKCSVPAPAGSGNAQDSSTHLAIYDGFLNQTLQPVRGGNPEPQLQVKRPSARQPNRKMAKPNKSFNTCLGFFQLENIQLRPDYLLNNEDKHITLDVRGDLVILRHPESNKYGGMMEGMNAAIIAALLATRKVRLSATIQHPNYLQVLVYASRRDCNELGDLLFEHDCFLQQPEAYDQTTTYYNPQWLTRHDAEFETSHSIRSLSLSSAEKKKVDRLFESATGPAAFKRVGVSELLNTKLKESVSPIKTPHIKEDLMHLRHQLKAVSMMSEKESGLLTDQEFPSLWTEIQDASSSIPIYYNTVSNLKQSIRPSLCRGGLLADEMGLGKTLTILALVVNSFDHDNSRIGSGPRPTLIVAPLSTLTNWEDQIKRHLKFESVQFMTYHGPSRRKRNAPLRDSDIILTTYDTLRADYSGSFPGKNIKEKKGRSGGGMLHGIMWKRVVLDEGMLLFSPQRRHEGTAEDKGKAHIIRNRGSQVFHAASRLEAQHRWCVTGTPIQNSVEDLGALIEFLRVSPFDNPSAFRREISCPIGGRNSVFWDRLKRLIQCISLRRTKESIGASLELPPRCEIEYPVYLTPEERRIYDLTKRHFDKSIDSGKSSLSTFNLLLRLRQVCNHGRDLLPKALQEWLDQACQYMDPSPPVNPTCEACEEFLPEEESICENLPCLHQICKRCFRLEMTDEGSIPFCPLCTNSPPELDDSSRSAHAASASGNFLDYVPSSKVQALIQNLRHDDEEQRRQGNPPPKRLVFSEWTSMLDLIGKAMTMNGVTFQRLDGGLNLAQRRQALLEFGTNPQCTVLLATLRCAGVGLDLTMASRVHLIEPGWNPMLERQALGRVHRLGQNKEVVSIRYVVQGSDSIEKYIRRVQVLKTDMITSSLDSANSDRTQIIEDILRDFRETVSLET